MPEGVVLCVRNRLECAELCLVMSDELSCCVGSWWASNLNYFFAITNRKGVVEIFVRQHEEVSYSQLLVLMLDMSL